MRKVPDTIANNLSIERDDFQEGWFSQHGSLSAAHKLFGEQLQPLMADLEPCDETSCQKQKCVV
jgi:hypothetical protein